MKRQLQPVFRVPPALRSRRKRTWPLLAGALLAAVATAWWLSRDEGGEIAPTHPYTVVRGDLKVTISAAAEVRPQNRIELRPPRAGRIDEILVDEGDRITKGQILALISSTDRASLLDAARVKGPDEAAKWQDVYKPIPLVAPLDGFIIARVSEPGQTIGAANHPLVMADRLIVYAQVDETDMAKVELGQDAAVTLDAYDDLRLPARVDHLAYEARRVNNVTVYDLEVALLNTSRILRSGMTATVEVTVAEKRGALLVPAEAFSEEDGKLVVRRRSPGGQSDPVPVSIGLSDGALVEVTDGLAEGDVLLVRDHVIPPPSLTKAGNPFRLTRAARKVSPRGTRPRRRR